MTHTQSVGLPWTRDQPVVETRHNGSKRQIAMLSTGFEPSFPAIERLQFYALEGVVTGIGYIGNIRGIVNWPLPENTR